MTAQTPRDLPPLYADREAAWQAQIEEVCRMNRPSELLDGDNDWVNIDLSHD